MSESDQRSEASAEPRVRAVGINHIALEVGSVDEATGLLQRLFDDLELRGRTETDSGPMAFLDLGDQFLALSEGREQAPDGHRHFGLVVHDREALRRRVEAEGLEILDTSGFDFLDPWGNRFQIVEYADVQFSKTDAVLRGMGLEGLRKSADALDQLAEKGMAP